MILQCPVPISGFSGWKKKPVEISSVVLAAALHAVLTIGILDVKQLPFF